MKTKKEQIIDMLDKAIRNIEYKHKSFLGTEGEVARRSFKLGLQWGISSLETLRDDIDRLEQQPEVSEMLNSAMDNTLAWRLGDIALKAGNPQLKGVGDYIDRGLILRKMFEEKGFAITQLNKR